jgi:hypothetical protein
MECVLMKIRRYEIHRELLSGGDSDGVCGAELIYTRL